MCLLKIPLKLLKYFLFISIIFTSAKGHAQGIVLSDRNNSPANLFPAFLKKDKDNLSFGFVDENNAVVIDNQFDGVQNFSEGLAGVLVNDKMGFINKHGHMVITPKFDSADPFKYGFSRVEVDGKWGLVNKKGTFIIEPKYSDFFNIRVDIFPDSISYYKESDLILYTKDGSGIINRKGEFIVGLKYDIISPLSSNLAKVIVDGKSGIINSEGHVLVTPQFNVIHKYYQGLAAFRMNEKWGFLDKKGRIVIYPIYDNVDNFSEGLSAVNLEGKRGYINQKGKFVIYGSFRRIESFSNGFARVRDVYGDWLFIDKKGRNIFGFKFDDAKGFIQGLAAVKIGSKWAFIDVNGDFFVPPKLDYVDPVNKYDDYLKTAHIKIVGIGDKLGVFNKKTSMMSKIVFDEISSSLSEDMIVVYSNGKCGYLNTKSFAVLEPKYDDCIDFQYESTLVRMGNYIKYINKKGQQVGSTISLEELKAY